MMDASPRKSRCTGSPPSAAPPGHGVSPAEFASYTLDLLDDLRKIAQRQDQGMLAHLLELAQAEARIIIREQGGPPQAQDTRLPG